MGIQEVSDGAILKMDAACIAAEGACGWRGGAWKACGTSVQVYYVEIWI